MIIAIGGKIASGKNTVCDIIQDLCKKHNGPSFEQKAFAGKLKQTASLLTGIPVEKFEDQDFKMTNLGSEWARPFYDKKSNVHYETITVRKFLQLLGTECMRMGLHVNTWVNALFADYIPVVKEWDELGNDTLLEYPNWIITDMRFPNEMDAVVERKGITIRVTRPVKKSETTPRLHPSETSLDNAEFDYEIINDGTLEDLVEKVRQILIKEGVI